MELSQFPGSANPAKKRRRPAKSCEQCRARKVKCDLEEPCGACIKSRAGLECTYDENSVQDGLLSRSTHTTQQYQGSVSSAAVPTTEPWGPRTSIGTEMRRPESFSTPQSRVIAFQAQGPLSARSVDRFSQTRTRRPETRPVLPSTDSQIEALRHRETGPPLSVAPLSPQVRITAVKDKYFGPTHWMQTAEQHISAVGQLHYKTADTPSQRSGTASHRPDAETRAAMHELREIRHEIIRRTAPNSDTLSPGVIIAHPDKKMADAMLCDYCGAFEPIYPILDVPKFHLEYIRYCEHPDSSTVVFRIKLSLVFAIGTTFCSNKYDYLEQSRNAHAWIQAAQRWLTGPSEKAALNLDGVQIACLLQLARQVTVVGTTSWLGMDVALRLAMAIGLHRDPDHFSSLSDSLAQMRRRLWYTAVELSLQSALGSNAPFTLRTDEYDTKLPINDDERDIAVSERIASGRTRDGTPVEVLIQRLQLSSLRFRLQTMGLVHSLYEAHDYEQAIQLGDKLKMHCDRINHDMNFTRAEESDLFSNSNFHERWLDICTRRYILLLHRPFILRARKDPKFYYSRKVCLETAMVIASYAEELKLPSEPFDGLPKALLVMRGPLNGPFSLDVIMILGLEMMTQMEEAVGLGSSSSMANMIAAASRAPVMRVLEHIQEQLFQIIARGSPSMKRYGYITALLSQLKAIETGRDPSKGVSQAITEALIKLKPLLEATLARLPSKDIAVATGAWDPGTGPQTMANDLGGPLSAFAMSDGSLFPGLYLDSMLRWDI